MKTYTLTDSDVKTLRELSADTHDIANARALDAFFSALLRDGYTHHTSMPSALSLPVPVAIVTGYESAL